MGRALCPILLGTAGVYGFLESRALEVLLLVGLFLLGGEFWDKFSALFRHRAKVEFAPARVSTLHEPLARRAIGLAGAALLSACTTVGPDFKRPQVPWLDDWTGGSLESLGADPRCRAAGSCRSGGATSTIPCSTSWLPRRSA